MGKGISLLTTSVLYDLNYPSLTTTFPRFTFKGFKVSCPGSSLLAGRTTLGTEWGPDSYNLCRYHTPNGTTCADTRPRMVQLVPVRDPEWYNLCRHETLNGTTCAGSNYTTDTTTSTLSRHRSPPTVTTGS